MITRFGKFTLIQRIGGGRLSQVFRVGRNGGAGPAPKVALKRVNPSLIGEPDFVELVVREAGILARLSHHNLCACQEMGVIDGCAFLTLEMVDGCTLRALMRRLSLLGVRLPASAVLALAYQLTEVLDYLHRRCEVPLVHLDLSPQNVMISQEGEIKLIDFGLARQLDGANPSPVGERIAGTVGYMSPEQARGGALDTRADQYVAGILLWEMLAGRRLYRGNTSETWERMRSGQVPPAGEILGDAPEELARVVARLLQPEPERRFADLGEVKTIIEASFASPQSGKRPLAALVQHLMTDEAFDPFDVVLQHELEPAVVDIPAGELQAEGYDELSIEVDFGEGTPGSLLRGVIPDHAEMPASPYLETLPEMDATGEG